METKKQIKKQFYEVIVGAFGIWYNATLVNDEARNRGLSTRIRQHKGKYCVSAGTFADEETAKENLLKVKNTGYVFAYIKYRKEGPACGRMPYDDAPPA